MVRWRGKLLRLLVLVVTVAVVVAGSAALSYQNLSQPEETDYPEYAVSEIVPERQDSTGSVEVESTDRRGTVLIDSAHANRFAAEQIQPLVSAITAAGYRVEYLERDRALEDGLSGADAFVVIDPGTRYSTSEVDAVDSFVEDGGRVVMIGEPTRGQISAQLFSVTITSIRNRLGTLSSRFGIEFSEGYLYNMERSDGNFQNVLAQSSGGDSLVEGVDRTAFYTAASVQARDGSNLLVAVEGTRNARGDTPGTYPLAVRNGNVVAIGDSSFVEGGNYNVADNEQFLSNLVGFLTGASVTRDLLDYPHNVEREPTIRYTSASLLGPAQSVAEDVAPARGQPSLHLSESVSAEDTDVLITTFDYLRENEVFGTGIDMRGERVSVPGFTADATGVVVVRAPEEGYDLVIAADTADRASRAASALSTGIEGVAISDRTAVIRTSAAETPTPTPTTPAGEEETTPGTGGAE